MTQKQFRVDTLPKWMRDIHKDGSANQQIYTQLTRLKPGQCVRVGGAQKRKGSIANTLRRYLASDKIRRDHFYIGTLSDGADALFYLAAERKL